MQRRKINCLNDSSQNKTVKWLNIYLCCLLFSPFSFFSISTFSKNTTARCARITARNKRSKNRRLTHPFVQAIHKQQHPYHISQLSVRVSNERWLIQVRVSNVSNLLESIYFPQFCELFVLLLLFRVPFFFFCWCCCCCWGKGKMNVVFFLAIKYSFHIFNLWELICDF